MILSYKKLYRSPRITYYLSTSNKCFFCYKVFLFNSHWLFAKNRMYVISFPYVIIAEEVIRFKYFVFRRLLKSGLCYVRKKIMGVIYGTIVFITILPTAMPFSCGVEQVTYNVFNNLFSLAVDGCKIYTFYKKGFRFLDPFRTLLTLSLRNVLIWKKIKNAICIKKCRIWCWFSNHVDKVAKTHAQDWSINRWQNGVFDFSYCVQKFLNCNL